MNTSYAPFPLRAAFAAAILLAAIGSPPGCNLDTNSVVESEARLRIVSLFAVNDDDRVTLGWTPPASPGGAARGNATRPDRTFDDDHPGPVDPADPGAVSRVMIYRGATPDFQLSASSYLGSVPATENRFVDTTIRNGQVRYYRAVPVGLLAGGYEKMGSPSAAVIGRPGDQTAGAGTNRFGERIAPIFESGCAVSGCHAGGGADHHAPAGLSPTGSLSLSSWADLLSGGSHGAVVVPFRPGKSHLLFHVNDDTLLAPVSTPHMPLPGFQLPRAQVLALRDWIAAGCPDDRGAIPFSTWPEGRVLITNQAEDLVSVIDRRTNLVGRYVRAGAADVFASPPEAPHNVTVDEERGFYYVNLVGSGKVLKYRLDTNEKIDEVGGILSPTQVALSPTGDTAWVAQFAPGVNAIKVIGTSPMRLLGEISAPNLDKPHGVQVTPDGRELWVTGNLSDNLLIVTLANLSTRLVQLNGLPPGQGGILQPYQTAMTSDNAKAYITCQKGNVVLVLDRATSAITATIPVGLHPLIPAITPDDRFVLVPNRNSNNLTVIDTERDSVTATIANVGPQPHGVAVTPDGRLAYVSCENVTAAVPPHHPTSGSRNPGFFAVIDLATMTVMERYEIGAFAAGVAITSR